jgi:Cu/Ag efflux protein CusF
MSRVMVILAIVTMFISGAVAAASAQAQAPSSQPKPPPPGISAVEQPQEREVEGTVRKVDPAAQTVAVSSGILGLFGTTLQVSDQTQILVEGRQSSLAGIREGARVKASYATRDGKHMAKQIDVMPAERESAPARAPRTIP